MADSDIEDIFGADPQSSARGEEIEAVLQRLQNIISADLRLLWTAGADGEPVMRPPSEWPDEIVPAIKRVSPGVRGVTVDFEDRTRATDIMARIKGLYRNEEENRNPLENAFTRIPRSELLKIKAGLDALTGLDQEADNDALA